MLSPSRLRPGLFALAIRRSLIENSAFEPFSCRRPSLEYLHRRIDSSGACDLGGGGGEGIELGVEIRSEEIDERPASEECLIAWWRYDAMDVRATSVARQC